MLKGQYLGQSTVIHQKEFPAGVIYLEGKKYGNTLAVFTIDGYVRGDDYLHYTFYNDVYIEQYKRGTWGLVNDILNTNLESDILNACVKACYTFLKTQHSDIYKILNTNFQDKCTSQDSDDDIDSKDLFSDSCYDLIELPREDWKQQYAVAYPSELVFDCLKKLGHLSYLLGY